MVRGRWLYYAAESDAFSVAGGGGYFIAIDLSTSRTQRISYFYRRGLLQVFMVNPARCGCFNKGDGYRQSILNKQQRAVQYIDGPLYWSCKWKTQGYYK